MQFLCGKPFFHGKFICFDISYKPSNEPPAGEVQRLRNILLIFLLLVLLPTLVLPSHSLDISVRAQPTWVKTYGGFSLDIFYSVQQTSDGGFIAAGESGSFGNSVTWVVKLDQLGNVVWQNVYGGDRCEGAKSVRQTQDGGFVVLTQIGACVLRLDGFGNLLWEKSYKEAGKGSAFRLELTSDGGMVLSGLTAMSSQPPDAFLLMLDADGNVLWQRTYGGAGLDSFGAKPTSNGALIAAGGTTSFGAGGIDAWVLKLDGSGNVLWQKAYGGPGTDGVGAVIETPDGGFITAGTTQLGPLEFDFWVLRLDSEGSVVWQKAYGFGQATSIEQTMDGGFLVAGVLGNDGVFLKLDQKGSILWQRSYGGSADDEIFSVDETTDGGFIAVGHTKSFGVPGEEGSGDGWVLRLDQAGRAPGQCHQKGRLVTSVTNTNSTTTLTQAVAIDTSTVVTEPSALFTVTSATIGVQCVASSRRP